MRQYPMSDEKQLTFDTGSEHTFNLSETLDVVPSWDFGNKIDPARVQKMCEEYPALKKAWDNFYSIYTMVDQDYRGKYEVEDDNPF